ncbi:MAG: Alcohol dehydrogenase GroES domain protein [Candidatus Saccharibacteria bacterium]|nr:Alcohol dehydrogenase GroES domain protein [Candidatus Saccharibacteria bacterium]
MKAVTWQGKRNVSVEEVPDPIIEKPTDAIIKITSTAICGSDLHLYEVMAPFMEKGDILGHEPMGIVQEVGSEIVNLKPGDRVVIPFNISCGNCFMCNMGLQSQCEITQVREHGRGAMFFGYSKLYGQVPGGQAEYLRVPYADYGAIKVPEGPSDERFLFLSDVLPTAWQAVQYASIPKAGSVAVLGLGPIGDMATRIAQHHNAGNVIGVDLVPERLARARQHGVDVVDASKMSNEELVEVLRDKTNGRGPDAVIDAVGMEAHGSPSVKMVQSMTNMLPDAAAEKIFLNAGVDRLTALHNAIEIVRRGGTISISGVYSGQVDPMSMDTLFDKQIQIRMGQANVRRWSDEIRDLLIENDAFGVEEFPTHRLSLDEAPHAYEIFQKKEDNAFKIVLKP